MTQELKLALIGGTTLIGIVSAFVISKQLDERRNVKTQQEQKRIEAETKIKKAEIEGTYPPEYWVAKKAEAEADAKVREARIESEERLKIDQRNRDEQERKAIREFEKDAPESYWQHKRLEEEEKTKRKQLEIDDRRRQRLEEQERDIAKKQVKSLEESTKTLEKMLRTANYATNMLRY